MEGGEGKINIEVLKERRGGGKSRKVGGGREEKKKKKGKEGDLCFMIKFVGCL